MNAACVAEGTLGKKERFWSEHERVCPHVSVNCPRCGDSISASQAESHTANVCALGPVTCVHCENSCARRDLDSHIELCPSVPVTCSDCFATVARSALESHSDDSCPRECTNAPCAAVCLGRIGLAAHVASVCLEARVACDFADVGCESPNFRRADLGLHLESAQARHIGLLAASNRVCLCFMLCAMCCCMLPSLTFSVMLSSFERVNIARPGAQARVTKLAFSLDCKCAHHIPSWRCSRSSASSLSASDQR